MNFNEEQTFAEQRASAVQARLRATLPEADFRIEALGPSTLRVRWTRPDKRATRIVRDIQHPASLAGTWAAVVEAVFRAKQPKSPHRPITR